MSQKDYTDPDLKSAEESLIKSLKQEMKVADKYQRMAAKNAHEVALVRELQLNYEGAKEFYKKQ